VTTQPDLLVVGAGPTGLAAALQIHDHGGSVRIIEKRSQRFRPSRALIVHPRTLEMLRPLGVTGSLLERADTSPRAELHVGDLHVGLGLTDLALPDTAFPHLTLLRQMDVETVLAQALEQRGLPIERGTELVGVDRSRDDGGSLRATLRSDGTFEHVGTRFVVGCDGAASTVRRLADIGWRGGWYRQEVVLADLELDGELAPDLIHVAVGRMGLLFLFALGERARWRLLATRPGDGRAPSPLQGGATVPRSEIQRLVDTAGLDVAVDEVTWTARVRLQRRLASSYQQGRLFLAGDAAHAHSPAAGQGMNTGIQDALNLGWKLAYGARRGPYSDLVASYEQERRPVARRVLAMTHMVFFAEASAHPAASFLRSTLAPLAAPAAPFVLRRRWLVAAAIRTLSQLRSHYRRSALSVEGAPTAGGRPRAGDRLPDETVVCERRMVRLHELTARPGIHVLLSRDADELNGDELGERVTLHRLTSRPGRGLVAVRPDGYVGFRGVVADSEQLGAWLDLVAGR
jgi:2-polyprenyl-6-methoxyphenol hydroxylase-like FAD-dependent oxidoreductase